MCIAAYINPLSHTHIPRPSSKGQQPWQEALLAAITDPPPDSVLAHIASPRRPLHTPLSKGPGVPEPKKSAIPPRPPRLIPPMSHSLNAAYAWATRSAWSASPSPASTRSTRTAFSSGRPNRCGLPKHPPPAHAAGRGLRF